MHSQATTPCMEASMGFQGEGSKDVLRENKSYGLVGEISGWFHPGKKINMKKHSENPQGQAFRVFVMKAITVGIQETGDLSLEKAQDLLWLQVSVPGHPWFWSAIASMLKWLFSVNLWMLFFPRKGLVGAGKLVLGRKMNRLLWHNSKANQTIRGKPHTLTRPQPLQLALATYPAQFSPLISGAQNSRTEKLRLLSLGSTGKLFWDPRATFKYIVGFCLMLLFILICLNNIWNFLIIKAIQITDKANIHPDLLFLQYQFPPQRWPLGLIGWVVMSFSLENDMKSPVFSEGNSRHKELRLQFAAFN